jgi:hypothetical protein
MFVLIFQWARARISFLESMFNKTRYTKTEERKGLCSLYPWGVEVALYVVSTVLVCLLAGASFPLIMACDGACLRHQTKRAAINKGDTVLEMEDAKPTPEEVKTNKVDKTTDVNKEKKENEKTASTSTKEIPKAKEGLKRTRTEDLIDVLGEEPLESGDGSSSDEGDPEKKAGFTVGDGDFGSAKSFETEKE